MDILHSDMAKYGGSCLCVFVSNNKVLNEILPDSLKRTLSRHFEEIPLEERKYVRYVTIDMWETYKDVAPKYFPNYEVAIDQLCKALHN